MPRSEPVAQYERLAPEHRSSAYLRPRVSLPSRAGPTKPLQNGPLRTSAGRGRPVPSVEELIFAGTDRGNDGCGVCRLVEPRDQVGSVREHREAGKYLEM